MRSIIRSTARLRDGVQYRQEPITGPCEPGKYNCPKECKEGVENWVAILQQKGAIARNLPSPERATHPFPELLVSIFIVAFL